MKDLNKKKTGGPEEILNLILSECVKELSEPMQIIF